MQRTDWCLPEGKEVKGWGEGFNCIVTDGNDFEGWSLGRVYRCRIKYCTPETYNVIYQFSLKQKNIYHFRDISEPQTSYQKLYTYGIGRAISSQAYGRKIGKGIKFRGKLMETEESGLREHHPSWELSLMLLESGWPSEPPWDFWNHLFGIDPN